MSIITPGQRANEDNLNLSCRSFVKLRYVERSYWKCLDDVCVEVLRPNQPNGDMSSAVSLPNHTFTGQA